MKISDRMHDNVRIASDALSRSINAQAEHWLRIGMLCELHPDLRYGEICQLLIRATHTGDDVLSFSAESSSVPAMPIESDGSAAL